MIKKYHFHLSPTRNLQSISFLYQKCLDRQLEILSHSVYLIIKRWEGRLSVIGKKKRK